MKKYILVYTVLLLTSVFAAAQSTVTVTNIEFQRKDSIVDASFDIHFGAKAVKSNYSLVVTPVLQNGTDKLEMDPVVLQGKKARIAAKRHEIRSGKKADSGIKYTGNGGTVSYACSFEHQPWMSGSSLVLDGIIVGCCNSTQADLGLIAGNMMVEPPKTEVVIYETETEEIVETITTGDRQALRYSFIAPIDDYETARSKSSSGELFGDQPSSNMANLRDIDQYIEDNRDGSLTIYFKQGKSTVEPGYRNNSRSLNDLLEAVRLIETSDDSKVTRIVIAGFTSPEGGAALNDRLAWDRATAVKNFLLSNSNLGNIKVNIYNGAIDWRGLRRMVAESDMQQKYRILDIIDNTPIWDSRQQVGLHGELMRLDGGNPYRYMYRYFFPELRNATYIKIYYENTGAK